MFKRPISLVLLTIALLLILSPVLSGIAGNERRW